MGAENEAKFTISGKISLCIIGTFFIFVLNIGIMIANYYAVEKRVCAIELREEKSCNTMNQILILNGKIEENLKSLKETLKDHVSYERGNK